jgi:hypothetical protein
MRFQTTALLVVLAGAVSLAQGVAARPGSIRTGSPGIEASGSATMPSAVSHAQPFAALTLDQAVALAERTYNARVVRADTQHDGERVVYVLRLLNAAGRVWTVRVDAQTGQMQ